MEKYFLPPFLLSASIEDHKNVSACLASHSDTQQTFKAVEERREKRLSGEGGGSLKGLLYAWIEGRRDEGCPGISCTNVQSEWTVVYVICYTKKNLSIIR